MKKLISVVVLIGTIVMLFGCSGYVNHYSAMMLITSSHGNEASMEFDTFDGTYHFKLRKDSEAAHTLDFQAGLVEGAMNIYIGVDGEKELLRSVKFGEIYDETITLDDKYDNEKVIYIILETAGKCVDGISSLCAIKSDFQIMHIQKENRVQSTRFSLFCVYKTVLCQKALAFPFCIRLDTEQCGDGRRNVLDRNLTKVSTGCKRGAAADHRNDHVFIKLGAVCAVVSAVVCRDDDLIIVGQGIHDLFDVLKGIVDGMHIFRRHPAVLVTSHIGKAEVQERKVNIVVCQIVNGSSGDAVVGILIAV